MCPVGWCRVERASASSCAHCLSLVRSASCCVCVCVCVLIITQLTLTLSACMAPNSDRGATALRVCPKTRAGQHPARAATNQLPVWHLNAKSGQFSRAQNSSSSSSPVQSPARQTLRVAHPSARARASERLRRGRVRCHRRHTHAHSDNTHSAEQQVAISVVRARSRVV